MNLYWEFHVGLWYSDILLVDWYSKFLRSDGLMASRCDELSERDKSISLTSSRTLLVHSFEQDTVDPTNRYSLMLILFLRCLRHPLFDVWSPERRGYVQDMFCDVFMLQDVRDPCLFSWQLQQSMWMVRDSLDLCLFGLQLKHSPRCEWTCTRIHVGLWYSDVFLHNWYCKYLRSDGESMWRAVGQRSDFLISVAMPVLFGLQLKHSRRCEFNVSGRHCFSWT